MIEIIYKINIESYMAILNENSKIDLFNERKVTYKYINKEGADNTIINNFLYPINVICWVIVWQNLIIKKTKQNYVEEFSLKAKKNIKILLCQVG